MDPQDAALLRQAIEIARDSARAGDGPFGALVARDGVVLGRGRNEVVLRRDPTAHAEVSAIREACRTLGSHTLAGCTLYASCEPCPMCLGAILWARLERVVHAADRRDAAAAGFDDRRFHEALRSAGALPLCEALPELRPDALAVLEAWCQDPARIPY